MKITLLRRKTIWETIGWLWATWFGSGLSPKAPGTVGSLCSLPIIVFGIYGGIECLLGVIICLFLIGWWATAVVLHTQKEQDPGFVVIDETVGQSITFLLALPLGITGWNILLGFLLFRFFDIVKIWPASFFDGHVHNAFGVMMDDVVAGIYAALVLYGIQFFV
ncbi:MAG: phosphatidylglycerophosphatase A [Pseudomonadota bacterium]|nr:phosphatidylglycerophosphatase A [Pseudomonadota bacterium]